MFKQNDKIQRLLLLFTLLSLTTMYRLSDAKRRTNRVRIRLPTDQTNHLEHPDLRDVPIANTAELQSDYWYSNAKAYLDKKLKQTATESSHKRAKNIILFMGDGMSLPTVTATRGYLSGDAAHRLPFEYFPHFGLLKTYCIDKQVPDSASTSTAYLSGVKANYGTIGVNAKVARYDCAAAASQHSELHTESIAKWAQEAGKWTGFVTTARVTHASPAGLYAHIANREWEHDGKISKDNCDPAEVVDIGRQLVEWPVGRELRVIMGGGRRSLLDKSIRDEGDERGHRTDGRDLIQAWLNDKTERNVSAEYIWQREDLLKTDLSQLDYLLGLFSSSHMPYYSELKQQRRLQKQIPRLSEMTQAAIEVLRRGEQGYFLFVEGAKIDMAHHTTRARRSLEETAEFARAIEVARNLTSEEDTLIVVIADHAHTMTINGYAQRGADILGLNTETALDGLPYTILSYANGPGYAKTYASKSGARKDLSKKNFQDPKRKYMATVPLESETHGGDDVGVFAVGPSAQYFTGNYEQSFIPLLMAKAAEIGAFS